MLDIIAGLNKQLSKAQLKSDLKGIDNTLSVKVIAKLATALSKKQLRDSLKQLNNLYVQVGTKFKTDEDTKNKLLNEIGQLQKNIAELQLKLNVEKSASQKAISSVISTAKMAQRFADKTSITLDVEVRKEKAVNDILYIGQKYSKLFSNISASQKYENLLNSAYSISDKSQLQKVKTEISAFTSELKASGLAAESTGQKWRKLLDRSKELFSAANIIRTIFIQTKQAVSTTIDLDKVYTDLVKVNDELNRNDYADYLSRCSKKAQELATTQKALIEGATEFSKSGYNLTTSNALTEKSIILSNVGDMSASDSAKAIISGVQAYDVVDGYTDVVSKAQALIDKYNELGNTASITTAELAKGVQSVGSVFADANTSVDQFLSLLSAGNRQYQNADSLALALRTSALRIRGASAELEEAGEDIEGVMSTLDNQKAIKALTGVDILESDQQTIRSIYDIFLDISKVYKDMSDVDQSALLDIIAGKHRASAISATLNNMTEAQEILQNSLNAAGSAQKEYNAYLESTEAHIQQFQAKLVETYSTLMNGDMISHVADLGSAMLDLVNNTGLLKHSLIAITTLKVGQGISTTGGAISGMVTQMKTLGSAIQQIKSLPLDDDLRKEVLDNIGEATKSLTEKNLKLLLSQKQLTEDDKIAILIKHNLTEEEALSKLETMGLTTATNANTVANTANAGSVNTLKGAFTGLTTSVKATWAAMSALQKASIIFAAISTAWSIGSSIINGLKQSNEELIQSTKESANAYKESASSIEDYASRYEELHKALIAAKGNEEETYNVKKQLLELQTELNDKFGEECGTVDLVTNAYESQTEAIKAMNKEKAQLFLNENKEGIDKAEKEMAKARHYNLSYTGMSSYTDEGAALKEIAEKYEENGISVLEDIDGTFSIHLNADAQSAYDTINAFETDLRNKAKELDDEHMFDDVLDISSDSLNKAKETIEQYSDIYKQALVAEIVSDDNKSKTYGEALQAVEAYNEAVLNSENPYDDKNVLQAKENLDTIKDSIRGNEEEWGKYSALFDDVFDQADTRILEFNEAVRNDSGLQELVKDLEGFSDLDLQVLNENAGENTSFDKLKESAGKYNISVEELINTLIRLGYIQGEIKNTIADTTQSITPTISSSIEQLATQLEPQFAKLGEAYKAIFTENGFTLDNVDNPMLEDLRKSFAEIGEEIGVTFDTSILESFFDALASDYSDSEEGAQKVQQAFNDLATAYFYSTETLEQLNEETAESIAKQLEEMGIVNADEIIENALALKEAKEALADVNLSDATYEDIEALIAEGQYSGLTADMIWALYDAKIAEQATTLSTSADCENLIALAGDTDRTSRSIQLLTQLMQIYNGLESGAYNGNRLLREEALGEVDRIKDELEKLANGESDETVVKPKLNINGNKGKKSGGSKSKKEEKDTTKEYDWIEQAIENVEKEIKELDEVADSSYSTFSQKNEALTKEIGKVTEEIELQQKAYEEYMRKADSIGLPDSYKELVQNGAINIEDIKDEKLQKQIGEYQKWYDKAQNASDAVKDLNTDIRDLQEEIKKLHIEAYEQQTEKLKDRLDSDSITEKQYLAELKSTYEQFYGGLEEYAEQYHEAVLEYLEEEKKYLNSVASAAASILDIEIDKIQDAADEQEEQIKGQIELLEARKKPLQDELDALDEKARKEELALNLQKAQYDLARAENQRSKLIYSEEKGMHYINDPKEVRDAQKDVDDAKLEIHKQSIQDQIDVLDDEITKYDELIDQINKAADAQVKALEKIKNKWQEVIDQQEQAKNITILTGEFGSDAITKILTGNDDDLLAQWKNSYLNTLKSLDLEAQGYIGDLTKQIEEIYRNSATSSNTVNAALVQNSSGKAVTLSDGTVITPDGRELKPYDPENDDSNFGKLYRAWTEYYGGISNNVDEIRRNLSQHLVIEHEQKMMNNVSQINNSNIRNVTNNENMEPVINQYITLECPNLTNNSGIEYIEKQLGHLSQRAMQKAYKR